jgi:hypothetical protein
MEPQVYLFSLKPKSILVGIAEVNPRQWLHAPAWDNSQGNLRPHLGSDEGGATRHSPLWAPFLESAPIEGSCGSSWFRGGCQGQHPSVWCSTSRPRDGIVVHMAWLTILCRRCGEVVGSVNELQRRSLAFRPGCAATVAMSWLERLRWYVGMVVSKGFPILMKWCFCLKDMKPVKLDFYNNNNSNLHLRELNLGG